nr:protein AHNAK2-like [Peromyscus maniculatus bairdii]
MCDCFHVVLPTWPGAPGSVTGRQLQSQEPGVETEEDDSVTEGPVGEIIRPRPQGSSPVYEHTAEGAGFGAQENNQGRHSSSGRRRSWWKRDSGESTAFSSMNHPESTQDATEVTLKTEVESGASGYTVTGGEDQGIFVKQVLKDSSAAKLFSLKEGDQLLSATIFFDHMKYEDALKILQYSEPYKVQFRIKRKLSASKGEESAIQQSQQGLKGQEKQDKESAEGYMETPTKTLEADGDRERLISKSRDGRQRRPQDRLSWPKFQALRSKRGTGPRRSHSSSEASEHRDTRDVSPTSTDTEAQLTAESREQKAGSGRRRRRFLNLRFGMSSGQGPDTNEQVGRDLQDRQDRAGVLQESQPQEDGTQAPGFRSALTMQKPTKKPSHPNLDQEGPGEMVVKTDRHHRKKKQLAKQEREKTLGQHRAETARAKSWDDEWEEVESLEIGIARLSLQDKPDQGGSQVSPCDGKTRETGFSQNKMKETKRDEKEVVLPDRGQQESGYRDGKRMQGQGDSQEGTGQSEENEREDKEQVTQTEQIKLKMPKFRIPSFGWSPTKEGRPRKTRQELKTSDYETLGEETLKEVVQREQRDYVKDRETTQEKEKRQRTETREEEQKTTKEGECSQREINFKIPKFKMPSFGVSAPGKPSVEASLEVAAPKVEGHLPKVQMPSLKMPKVDLKGPHVELKGPKVDVRGPKGELTAPEVEIKGSKGRAGMLQGDVKPSLSGTTAGVDLVAIETTVSDMHVGSTHSTDVTPAPCVISPSMTAGVTDLDVRGDSESHMFGGVSASEPLGELTASITGDRPPSCRQRDHASTTESPEMDPTAKEMSTGSHERWFKMPKFRVPGFRRSSSKERDGAGEEEAAQTQTPVVSVPLEAEGALATVQLSQAPEPKVPKFSFQASSSEADVFFPVVREVQCTEASIGSAVHKDSPGLWEASILKTGAEDPRAPPASLEQSLGASPISKVRVHIQGSQGESQEVMICGRVEREGEDSSAHGAFSTQIVRESEIPASTVQIPSYGFSLLKVKIPDPPVQPSVYTVAPDSQAQEGLCGAPPTAAGDIPPDAGEPFEMISSSAGMLPLSPEVPPGPQLADSTSDEEPAEILEFPEDSQEVKTPEMATKQKSEGKKASLLWSWLPSIGFSSVEETAADSRDAAQRPAPVHVQPAARPDPDLPRKQERAGWFRFPKLGFSSSPTKKSRSTEGEEGQAEQRPQEETITFFDARESFSPEEGEEEEAETEVTNAKPGSKAMVASSARTELVLLEQTKDTGDKSAPRPVAQ